MTSAQPPIEKLRDEFEQNQMRGWLWPWLQRSLVTYIERRIKGHYRPQVYSPTGEWDVAGCGDLANEFIIKRGIEKGGVGHALIVAPDTERLLAYLGLSLKRFVIAERPSSMSANVFERLRDVLDQRPAFMRLGGVPPRSRYGLADWEDDPPPAATDDSLREAARFVPAIGWAVYGSGNRQSPGISSGDLERIALALFLGMNLLLTSRQIMAVINRRFLLERGPIGDSLTSLETDHLPGRSNPLEDTEAQNLAERAFLTFTERQRTIVRLMLEDPDAISTRDLASRLNISKSTAANELQAIQRGFRLLGASSEEIQRQILDVLWPKLRAS
ncbi:hypothetical protein BH09GEM1_BH09GEM1_22670 [soil metagenome]